MDGPQRSRKGILRGMRVGGKALLIGPLLWTCGSRAEVTKKDLRFCFVLNGQSSQSIRAQEAASLPLDYDRVYVLRSKNGVVDVPKGFLTSDPPPSFTVTRIIDPKGCILSSGDSLEPGKFGYQGMVTRVDAKLPFKDHTAQYFVFGPNPPSPTPHAPFSAANNRSVVRLEITIEAGFTGDVEAVEDPGLPLDFGRVYRLCVAGKKLRVPKGFLHDASEGGPYRFEVTELREAGGRILSRGTNAPSQQVGVRALSGRVAPGSSVTHYYFEIRKGFPQQA